MTDPIRPTGKWRQLRGVAHGLQQPTLIGTISISRLTGVGLHDFESGLQGLIDESLPAARSGTTESERLAELFAFCVGAVQRQNRIAVSEHCHWHDRAQGRPREAEFRLALPSPDPRASRIAVDWVLSTFRQLAQRQHQPAQDQDLRHALQQDLRPFAEPGLNRFSIIQAANRLDLPLHHLAPGILVLGTGMHARWMQSTITDATPYIGVTLVRKKHETASVLRAAGLPGGINRLVSSAEEAVGAALHLSFPVVVKPADADQGHGVAADLRDKAIVARAYEAARKVSPSVLVEKWQPGHTHRLTVFNQKVVRVVRRIAGGVVGDGLSDLACLVTRFQQTERQQAMRRRLGRSMLELDEEALGLLRQSGLDASHVPAAGEYVKLRRRDNINAGGTNEELDPASVHPDNLSLAVDTAALFRLDFAGIDFITEDISSSWFDTGGLICEVNAQPQMGSRGRPTLYQDLLAEFMGAHPRVPSRLLVCPSEDAQRKAALERALADTSFNGASDRTGLWIDGRRVTGPFEDGLGAARALLIRTEVKRAACLMTPKEIAQLGLPLNRWDAVEWPAPEALTADERLFVQQARSMLRSRSDASARDASPRGARAGP